MTTYNTYQEAKIENPNKEIIRFDKQDEFKAVSDDELSAYLTTWTKCDPADHCMTVERFLADGHKFVKGDAVLYVGDVCLIESGFDLGAYNDPYDGDSKIFILRAAALENIPTETPEEKEVLDGIESAGEVEWKSGDIAMLYGDQVLVIAYHPNHPVVVVETNDNEYLNVGINDLSKPETPHQRKDRERACAIYDMCAEADIFTEESNFWAGKFYDLGYTKEKTHGTN
ncbi:hypothetical protein NVP1173O_76 [Vibrio phage 1.173.O._10N.261.55.A11]|nr:hypothetical protein NVP1173O_76 [Vibrio phage 1.173.O._10N.261.55.A11]